ncbi:putative U-box domain-containing protein 4-like [Capsicum annuum]|nr:putative U-box domain-containing protein 4-like [Capsicum annuum]KAF3684159.1 putative U-box domain-containing protein 4-like [Capsicum annuum]
MTSVITPISSCGFCGNPTNKTFCSQCYNTVLEEETDEGALALFEMMSSLKIKTRKDDSTMKTKPQRCMVCRKKVGLIGFSCKCDEILCEIHRYPEEHACACDFKSIGRAVLAKENPLCKGDKLENRI